MLKCKQHRNRSRNESKHNQLWGVIPQEDDNGNHEARPCCYPVPSGLEAVTRRDDHNAVYRKRPKCARIQNCARKGCRLFLGDRGQTEENRRRLGPVVDGSSGGGEVRIRNCVRCKEVRPGAHSGRTQVEQIYCSDPPSRKRTAGFPFL